MVKRSHFWQYFQQVTGRLKSLEENAQLLNELVHLSEEMAQLEQIVQVSFENLDHQFDTFLVQVGLLSDVIDFQRTLLKQKNKEEIARLIFQFFSTHLPETELLLALRFSNFEPNFVYLANGEERESLFRKKLTAEIVDELLDYFRHRDMAVVLNNVQQYQVSKIPWEIFEAHSILMFPLIVRGNLVGFGLLSRKKGTFQPREQSLVNLVSGVIALGLYQHLYLNKLKGRLFKQFKTKKLLEEVKYAEYFDKGPVFIFALDPRGVVLHANQSTIERLGVEEEYVLGEKFVHFLPSSVREPFQRLFQSLEEGENRFFRTAVQANDGQELILDLYLTKLELQNRFSLILIFGVDASEQAYRLQQETTHAVLREISLISRQAMGQLNNLLLTLRPSVDFLRQKVPSEPLVQERLKMMEEELKKAEQMVQRFLNYGLSRLSAPETVHLNKLIQEFAEGLKQRVGEQVELLYSLDPGVPPLLASRAALERLLDIFAQNSLDALGDNKGYLHISTQLVVQRREGLLPQRPFYLPAGKYVELVFEDNGPGMAQEQLKDVFKPYYTTKIQNQGMGLGLFAAYNIVEQMGGAIFVKSAVGQGTRVYCYFPVDRRTDRPATSEEIKQAVATSTKAVLVVDDEYNIRSVISEVLEMNGFRVFTAANGQEALEIFQQHASEIGLVILDMIMPIMDGRQAFQAMKRLKPDQKIIIISGYAQQEDLQEILSAGALAFLSKPFQVKDILKKVKEALN